MHIAIRRPKRQVDVVLEYVIPAIVDDACSAVADIVFEPLIGCCSVVIKAVAVDKYPIILEIVSISTPSVAP